MRRRWKNLDEDLGEVDENGLTYPERLKLYPKELAFEKLKA